MLLSVFLLIADTAEYQKRYSSYFLGKQEKVLFEEVVNGAKGQYLVGHNERYVKIGVPLDEAEKKGENVF